MKAQTFIQTGAGSSRQGQVPAPVQTHTERDRQTHAHTRANGWWWRYWETPDTQYWIGLETHTIWLSAWSAEIFGFFSCTSTNASLHFQSSLLNPLVQKLERQQRRWKKRLIQTSQYLCFSSAVKPGSVTVEEFQGHKSNLCQWVNCEQHCPLWPRRWWSVEQAVQE